MFIPGRELSRSFFLEAAEPVLARRFPDLRCSAGLLGYGSDVLGYDDPVSTDHMWGPRFYLFLEPADLPRRDELMEAFSRELPPRFRGYSVNFSQPDGANRVRAMAEAGEGPVSPLIFIGTMDDYLCSQIGSAHAEALDARRWLAVSEHRLLSLSLAEFYRDDLALAEQLAQLRYYPKEVRLYLIASQWSVIASEQAFSRRCSQRGDELGSRIICARLVERLMRLGFLYCGVYAPYSKWLGTAFARLPLDPALGKTLHTALAASNGAEREAGLILAQVALAEMHNASGLTPPMDFRVESYYRRDIKVIFAERFAEATARELRGTELEGVPLFGAVSDIGGLCEAADRPEALARLMGLYERL